MNPESSEQSSPKVDSQEQPKHKKPNRNKGNKPHPKESKEMPIDTKEPTVVTSSTEESVSQNNITTEKKVKNKKPQKKANPTNAKNPARINERATKEELKVEIVSCPICLEEHVSHLAVGHCLHGVCSTCALRIRCKSHSNTCAICKTDLPCMLVYPVSESPRITTALPYQMLLNNQLSIDDVLPDCNYDHNHRLIYYHAKDHFSSMQKMKSLYCPVKHTKKGQEQSQGQGKEREENNCQGLCFRDHKQLLQHLDKLHPEEKLCQLCLDHRPLFLHEYELYSKKQMKVHMKDIHTICQFCNEYFFDKTALYNHMQSKHFTCHLCPGEYMFRYYATQEQVRYHYHAAHYVCTVCDENQLIAPSDIAYSFKHLKELITHMKDIHHHVIRPNEYSTYLLSSNAHSTTVIAAATTNQGSKKSNQQQFNAKVTMTSKQHVQEEYIDLDMGSASPFLAGTGPTPHRPNLHPVRHQTNRVGNAANPLANISSNMRIAGRISGAGKFSLGEEEEALQALLDQQQQQEAETSGVSMSHASSASSHSYASRLNIPSNSLPRGMNTAQLDELFPSLSGKPHATSSSPSTADLAAPASSAAGLSTNTAHPMSLVGKLSANTMKSSTTKVSTRVLSEEEEKKRSRQQQLAEAFAATSGGDNSKRSMTNSNIPLSYNELQKYRLEQTFQHTAFPKAFLHTLLYPPEVLQWGKQHKSELLLIEKKLHSFLLEEVNKDVASVSFKPMTNMFDRQILHCIGKYYQCNTYEYDATTTSYGTGEKKRYVSFVKTLQSSLPTVLLSTLLFGTSTMIATSCGVTTATAIGNIPFIPYTIRVQPLSTTDSTAAAVSPTIYSIYLSMISDLIYSWGRVTDTATVTGNNTSTSKEISVSSSGQCILPFSFAMISVGEILSKLRNIILDAYGVDVLTPMVQDMHGEEEHQQQQEQEEQDDNNLWKMTPSTVSLCGMNGLVMKFSVYEQAVEVYELVSQLTNAVWEETSRLVTITSCKTYAMNSPILQKYLFLRYYKMTLDFPLPVIVSSSTAPTALEGMDKGMDTGTEQSVKTTSDSIGQEYIIQTEPEITGEDAWDVTPTTSAKPPVLPASSLSSTNTTAPPGLPVGSTTTTMTTTLLPVGIEVDDDWEHIADADAWNTVNTDIAAVVSTTTDTPSSASSPPSSNTIISECVPSDIPANIPVEDSEGKESNPPVVMKYQPKRGGGVIMPTDYHVGDITRTKVAMLEAETAAAKAVRKAVFQQHRKTLSVVDETDTSLDADLALALSLAGAEGTLPVASRARTWVAMGSVNTTAAAAAGATKATNTSSKSTATATTANTSSKVGAEKSKKTNRFTMLDEEGDSSDSD